MVFSLFYVRYLGFFLGCYFKSLELYGEVLLEEVREMFKLESIKGN